ncbi:MAG TPA: macrolide ABC transporter ATP-binding protein [Verrucomicrobiales bacterium]|nr:macrolide ABC transporter ATP-binding protein [Verrucomicrobiales bacterium]
MPPIIELRNVHKVYSTGDLKVHAVKGVTLTVQPGEFIAVMGASGSGKSTLMNILGCLDQPTDGDYLLDGVAVARLSREELADIRNSKLGFIFQGFNLLSRTSALENIELPMLYARPALSAREQRKRALEALELVGLGQRGDHHPNQLSGGQQQRVAIARSLVMKPALILADEPTGNLDSRTSIEIMGAFQELNKKGITIAMVTHELDIAQYARRNVVMKDGLVLTDKMVENRLDARAELEKLSASQTATLGKPA